MDETTLYRELVENLYDGVYFVDADRKISFWNKSAERITGYGKEEVLKRRCSDNILRHVDQDGNELCIGLCPLAKTLKDGEIRELEVFLHHKAGYRVPVSVRVSPVRDMGGRIVGAVEIFSDNSKRQEILEEMENLKHDVYVDGLTGIGNRKYGELSLGRCFHDLKQNGTAFGLLFIDIDEFKLVNDTYGHDMGDRVLAMTVKTILALLRKMDVLCRWGGEEFILILPNVDLKNLEAIAERTRVFVEKNWVSGPDADVKVTISIGATLASAGDDVDSLVKRADSLLYKAKRDGRNLVRLG
jgi:diguanylate cyclase (GGDEF)-like protein/PAS domain S-box-containing protein